MRIPDLLDWIRHRPAQPNSAFYLPPEPHAAVVAEPGYFQLRLAEMRLTDDRQWFTEIVPATFVQTEFTYGGEAVRRPFFVSNGLLSNLPQGVDGGRLRVNFRDTLVLGPTPGAGADVALFVGLFQMGIADQLKSAFSILEKLFQVVPGPAGNYLKLAEKLADEIAACLGDTNLTCLLGDRLSLGTGLPRAGYQVYLRANGVPVVRDQLTVVDGALMQRQAGGSVVPVTDRDYCLVKIEHLAQRSDYASLPFHAVFETARISLVKGERDMARLQTLECIGMVYGSPDLTEDDKARLIAFYQAKLLAVQTVRGDAPAGISPVQRMQARALQAYAGEGDALADSLNVVGDLHAQFESEQVSADKPVTNEDVSHYLETPVAPARKRPDLATLMKAVAAGSLVP